MTTKRRLTTYLNKTIYSTFKEDVKKHGGKMKYLYFYIGRMITEFANLNCDLNCLTLCNQHEKMSNICRVYGQELNRYTVTLDDSVLSTMYLYENAGYKRDILINYCLFIYINLDEKTRGNIVLSCNKQIEGRYKKN